MNGHEQAARLRKVMALLTIIDRNARHCGMPELAGTRGVETLRPLSARDWGALAREANVHPPSASTIALLLETVAARGKATEAREPLELFGSEIPF